MKRGLRILCLGPFLLLGACATSSRHRLDSLVAAQQEADQAYARGDMQQALKDYQALAQEVPGQALYWFRLGNVQFRLQQPEEAVKAYEHALRLDQGNAKAWYNLGIVRLRMAEAAFMQAAQQGSKGDPVQRQGLRMADGIAGLTGADRTAKEGDATGAAPKDAAPKPRGNGT
jgi:tetratricopeptide (TPR) repeat protein